MIILRTWFTLPLCCAGPPVYCAVVWSISSYQADPSLLSLGVFLADFYYYLTVSS